MKERMKNMKVNQKLRFSFSSIMAAFIVTIVVAIGAILLINNRMQAFYEVSHANTVTQMEVRKDVQLVGKYVLWSLTTTDEAVVEEMLNSASTYAENVSANVEKLKVSFDDKVLIEELDAALVELKSVRAEVMELAKVNANEEALEIFNGRYTDATDKLQDILVQIGTESEEEAENAYRYASVLGIVSAIIMALLGIFSVLLSIRLVRMITGSIAGPIEELEAAAVKLKKGELDIDIEYESQDELGMLADNFRGACSQMNEVIDEVGVLLGMMADGKFNIHTEIEEKYVGKFRILIDSMRTLNRQLNTTLKQINESSDQVAIGAEQMSEGAQSLAEGATDQAGAVEELTATVEDVANLSTESAEAAENSAEKVSAAEESAEQSRDEMAQLTAAMERINETSKEIENIIGAIEDIATQTNLLSLNASIEAARAGDAGRGFAVVADQIGKLASDSAQSVVTTRELIEKTIEEIENGSQITTRTAEAITGVLSSMSEFAITAKASAEASRTQADMLKQIEAGIEQISTVVQNNSASAEETSAVSEELSAQAEMLKEMVAQFELREE